MGGERIVIMNGKLAVSWWTLERIARDAAEVVASERSTGPVEKPEWLHPPRVRTEVLPQPVAVRERDRFVAAFAVVGRA